MSWTQEKEEKLRQLWEKGHTASQIAEILGDTTRNAVIGKAHRLKLAARAPNKKSVAQKKKFLMFKIETINRSVENLDLNQFF